MCVCVCVCEDVLMINFTCRFSPAQAAKAGLEKATSRLAAPASDVEVYGQEFMHCVHIYAFVLWKVCDVDDEHGVLVYTIE